MFHKITYKKRFVYFHVKQSLIIFGYWETTFLNASSQSIFGILYYSAQPIKLSTAPSCLLFLSLSPLLSDSFCSVMFIIQNCACNYNLMSDLIQNSLSPGIHVMDVCEISTSGFIFLTKSCMFRIFPFCSYLGKFQKATVFPCCLGSKASQTAAAAVSYTHLDVYKRQQ